MLTGLPLMLKPEGGSLHLAIHDAAAKVFD